MHYLDGLNEEQKKAALSTEGPVLVVAGAGTGKTKTLTYRILHLIHSGVAPYHILAITFTNKAAREMEERVADLLEGYDTKPTISTFHALGVRILREHHRILGMNKYFNILDSQDRQSLIKQAMKQLDIDPKEWEPRKIGSVISRAKGDQKTEESYTPHNNPLTAIAKTVWQRYEALKKEEQSLDFDDLIAKSHELLSQHPEILAQYQDRFRYIHVDEYQDTNTLQYKIVRLLAGERMNVCAVGDGDQNIYSWRGADMRNILNFEKDFPGAEVIVLEKNYRSTQNILEAAHRIISKNTQRIDKKLVTDNPEGTRVIYYEGFSAHDEAHWVADTVQHYLRDDVRADDIAVLFRTNFQSRVLEEAFLKRLIPYQVLGVKFFSRKEVKDVMSYLKAALNPASLADLKRIINEPKRGIGKVAVAKIFAGKDHELSGKAATSFASFKKLLSAIADYTEDHSPSETIKYIIKHTGFETALSKGSEEDLERLENMKELVSYAQKYDDLEDAYEHFLEEVALLSDQDSLKNSQEGHSSVKLMTIHASKGLEFRYVFVVGLEQGLFPALRHDAKDAHEEEEERRLCYVAFTRAKEQLHLSYAKIRTIYGQQRINEASEFLRDLPESLLEGDERLDYVDDDGEAIETYFLDF